MKGIASFVLLVLCFVEVIDASFLKRTEKFFLHIAKLQLSTFDNETLQIQPINVNGSISFEDYNYYWSRQSECQCEYNVSEAENHKIVHFNSTERPTMVYWSCKRGEMCEPDLDCMPIIPYVSVLFLMFIIFGTFLCKTFRISSVSSGKKGTPVPTTETEPAQQI